MKRRLSKLFHISGILIITISLICVSAVAVWSAESDYDGTYYGSFSGDDSGVWVALLQAGSQSAFLSYSNSDQGDAGYIVFLGESGGFGNFQVSSTEIAGSLVNATVNSFSGAVSGTWSNSFSGDSGTLSGNRLISSDFVGSYSGTFSGDSSGIWSMTVASNGYISGALTSTDGSGSFEGVAHPDGFLLAVGTDSFGNDFGVFATISGSSISGSWESETGEEGTLSSGTGGGSSGGGYGDGGGGSCFILNLINP